MNTRTLLSDILYFHENFRQGYSVGSLKGTVMKCEPPASCFQVEQNFAMHFSQIMNLGHFCDELCSS